MLLTAAVVGSGIMADNLSGGNAALALLANTFATVATLAVLIAVFAPTSGAHFNPAVSLAMWLRGKLPSGKAAAYACVQFAGCALGALLAHAMFGLPLLQLSGHLRTGYGQWLAEVVATAGLIVVIISSRSIQQASWRVPAWIGGAYWFTASTSFANPAITVGRSLSDTFSGIAPASVPTFIAAQLLGSLIGVLVSGFVCQPATNEESEIPQPR